LIFLWVAMVQANEDLSKWQRTPVGLAHPSCIHKVPSGSHVYTKDGEMFASSPDGSAEKIPRCLYPWNQAKKNVSVSDFAPGWQVWTTYQSMAAGGVTQFLGYFSIPDDPANADDGQTLFMFTGLQNSNWIPGPNSPPAPEDFEIIQPVLQWGSSAGGGGSYWTLASWYVTVYNGFLISDLINVNAGDTIFGNMTLIGPSKWYISGVVQSSNQATTLTATKKDLKVNPWAYCTLEVYDDTGDCGDYPTQPQVYTKLLISEGSKRVTPKWQVNITPDPICNEHATVESHDHVTLHFDSQ